MKILLFANTDWYLYNFRLPLVQALRAQGHEVVLVFPAGRFTGRLEAAGFRCIAFPLARRRINPLMELITVVRLAWLYTRERPDLVHHFTIKCVLYGSLAARLARVKAVVNSLDGLGHFYADRSLQSRILRFVINGLGRLALRRTQVIFQNPDDHLTYIESGLVSRAFSHLIKSVGVDVTLFTPAANSKIEKKKQVLFASRLLWTKGLAEYVEAARIVNREIPDAVFLIAGEPDAGNPATVSQRALEGWKKEEHLKLLGHVEDVRTLLRNSDLVVLPSYYREGIPRILIEAAACGKALVTTDMPGCREIVFDGVNGLLVPPRDKTQLASAIKTLLLDDTGRVEMGRQSRLLACREFTQEHVTSQTLDVYRATLSASRTGQVKPFVQTANNVRMRRAIQAMSNVTELSELLDALREMLEFDEFVYVNMRLGGEEHDYARSRISPLHTRFREKHLESIQGVQLRDGMIHWSWRRSGVNECEVLGASDYWSLRLPISTERTKWGFINLYQEVHGDSLNLNINYLSQKFQPELARAVERVMSLGSPVVIDTRE